MRHLSISSKPARGLLILVLVLLGLALAPRSSLAQSIIQGNQLDADVVIDNDVIMSGDTVTLSGTVQGLSLIHI